MDLIVDRSWQSINSLSSLPIGTKLTIQNKSTSWLYLFEGSQPVVGSTVGYLVAPFDHTESSYAIVTTGSDEIWARTLHDNQSIFVQELV